MDKEWNTDIEEWAKRFDEEFQKSVEDDRRRRKENGLILCVVYDNELWDHGFNKFRASFELRKEDLNDYVYVDNQKSLNFCCDPGYENYFVNRKCKFVRIENDGSAIFYRDY